jgi:hypothetical protein
MMIDLGIANQSFFIETGNMLIMTFAYARASGDGSLISRYVCPGSIFSLAGLDAVYPDSIRC